MTFEQVDQHVEKNYAKVSSPSKATNKKASPQASVNLTDVKKYYLLIKPILGFVTAILPKKWTDYIKAFIAAMDSLTGQTV